MGKQLFYVIKEERLAGLGKLNLCKKTFPVVERKNNL